MKLLKTRKRVGYAKRIDKFLFRLAVADEKNVKSIAFPALGGSSVGGFPKEAATKGMVLTCLEYTKDKNPKKTVVNIKFMNADQAIVKTRNFEAEK